MDGMKCSGGMPDDLYFDQVRRAGGRTLLGAYGPVDGNRHL